MRSIKIIHRTEKAILDFHGCAVKAYFMKDVQKYACHGHFL
jgi:hypothetical protein